MTTQNQDGGEIRIGETNHSGFKLLSIRFKTGESTDLESDDVYNLDGLEIVSVKILPGDGNSTPNKQTEYTVLDSDGFDLLMGIGKGLERGVPVLDCPRFPSGAPVVITSPIRFQIHKAGKSHEGRLQIGLK